MFEIGRLCVKIAGRDAGKKCVVIDVLKENYVLIDGLTRRRKCNITHLEPLKEKIDLKKNASAEDVKKAFKKLGMEIIAKKPKKSSAKPKKVKKIKKSVEEKAEKKAKKVKEDRSLHIHEESKTLLKKAEVKKKETTKVAPKEETKPKKKE